MPSPIEQIHNLSLAGKKIVFTNGCFDILHLAHIRLFDFAKKQGDYLVVGLNSDDSVKCLKGPSRPINNLQARKEVLLALKSVDYVIAFEEDTPLELIKKIKPNVLLKGGDYSKDSIVGSSIIEDYGGEVIVFPYINGYSTTSIIGGKDE